MIKQLNILLCAIVLAGCSTSGLDASSSFKCSYEDNFSGCSSVSNTYKSSTNSRAFSDSGLTANSTLRKTPYSGMPVRTPVTVMRIWVAPWEDKDGDLRDQSFVYIPLNQSKWNIEHNYETIIDEYRPTTRLLGDGGVKSKSSSNGNSNDTAQDKWLNDGVDRTQDPLRSPPNLIPSPVK